jgi:oxygen-independent coproporphyrinogen-3 oxidase
MDFSLMRAAIYAHIPFCASKCAYCDFASYAKRERDVARYLHALAGEMRAAEEEFGRLQAGSIFFGGGTPSLLSGEQMGGLMNAMRSHFDVEPDAEITAEANPGTVDVSKLSAYRRAGINRLSFGVQAMQDTLLRSLGRIHDGAQATEALRDAAAAGFDNVSVDLMYALSSLPSDPRR